MARILLQDPVTVAEWVAKQVGQTASWGSFYALGAEEGGEIVAGLVVNNFNGVSATAHVAIARPGRYLPQLLFHLFDYAFNFSKLKRLTGLIPASNKKSLAFARHLGFEDEFEMRDAAPDGGPMQVLVMWPANCRWLARS